MILIIRHCWLPSTSRTAKPPPQTKYIPVGQRPGHPRGPQHLQHRGMGTELGRTGARGPRSPCRRARDRHHQLAPGALPAWVASPPTLRLAQASSPPSRWVGRSCTSTSGGAGCRTARCSPPLSASASGSQGPAPGELCGSVASSTSERHRSAAGDDPRPRASRRPHETRAGDCVTTSAGAVTDAEIALRCLPTLPGPPGSSAMPTLHHEARAGSPLVAQPGTAHAGPPVGPPGAQRAGG